MKLTYKMASLLKYALRLTREYKENIIPHFDLCTRSGTSFDCNKFLRSDDMTPVVTTITPKRTADYKITEYVGDVKTIKPSNRPLVESGPLVREAAKYGECIV